MRILMCRSDHYFFCKFSKNLKAYLYIPNTVLIIMLFFFYKSGLDIISLFLLEHEYFLIFKNTHVVLCILWSVFFISYTIYCLTWIANRISNLLLYRDYAFFRFFNIQCLVLMIRYLLSHLNEGEILMFTMVFFSG